MALRHVAPLWNRHRGMAGSLETGSGPEKVDAPARREDRLSDSHLVGLEQLVGIGVGFPTFDTPYPDGSAPRLLSPSLTGGLFN